MFNYIITIHNKQDLLPRVLEGIAMCCSKQSKIIPVLDSCTDCSEAIVDEFIARSGLNVEKIIMPDVYELRAINAGMARVTDGFIMTIQDDVILNEPDLERKIITLCDEVGASIGVISPRHGVNVRRMPILHQLAHVNLYGLSPLIDEFERIATRDDPCKPEVIIEYEQLEYRMVAGGSPMIIPEHVWKIVGQFDDAMSPHMWFDHEYSLRALCSRFRNVVFPLRFISQSEWGTSRIKNIDSAWNTELKRVSLRNRRYIWKKHGRFINLYNKKQGKPAWIFK